MSVILDALRKLDREKLSRRSGTANIAVDILRPDLERPRKKIPVTIATVSLTAIATAVITYVALFKFGLLPRSSQTTPRNLPSPSQQVVPVPSEPGFPSKSLPPEPIKPLPPNPQIAPAPPSPEPVYDARDEKSKTPLKIQSPDESKSPTISVGDRKASQIGISEKTESSLGNTKKTAVVPTESVTTPPSLKLSAIVWYEEPSRRFAMINGMKATEGSVIEGVKVVEIHPTSVRFLHKDQYFEIPMSK